ncbi:MAG: ABC transporter substrate-binding protein, partial [Actinobacteria bacterium]|nr:ABC transporter substrate-binding protein [Actinomycetota bacterium]
VVIPGITTDAFYISMKRGVEQKAKELGINIIYQGAPEWDYTKQIPIIESMIAKKVDLIITAPTNAETMIVVLKKAVDSGIPVITVDTNIKDDSFIVSNITSDNLQGGKVAAGTLAKILGSKGEVALINTKPGITTTDDRQNGFIEALKTYPDMKLVSSQYCNDQAETAAAQIQNIYLAHPNLKGVFACNVVSANGVQAGLKAKGLTGKIALFAYDAGPAQVEGLKAGYITALVVQKPLAEGSTAVEYAYYYLTGQKDKVEKHKLIPAVIATKENMNDPDVSKWFYTTD